MKATIAGQPIELVNLTPHPVTVFDTEGKTPIVTLPSSGMVRVPETVRILFEGDGDVPLVKIERDPHRLEGLPTPTPGTYYIVSDMAYQAATALGRQDLLRTGPAVRDSSGNIIGCKGLAV